MQYSRCFNIYTLCLAQSLSHLGGWIVPKFIFQIDSTHSREASLSNKTIYLRCESWSFLFEETKHEKKTDKGEDRIKGEHEDQNLNSSPRFAFKHTRRLVLTPMLHYTRHKYFRGHLIVADIRAYVCWSKEKYTRCPKNVQDKMWYVFMHHFFSWPLNSKIFSNVFVLHTISMDCISCNIFTSTLDFILPKCSFGRYSQRNVKGGGVDIVKNRNKILGTNWLQLSNKSTRTMIFQNNEIKFTYIQKE